MPSPQQTPPAPPVVDPVALTDLDPGEAGELVAGADLEGREHTAVEADRLELRGAQVHSSRLRGLQAREADLRNLTLTEVVMEQVAVPVVQGIRGRWRDVELRDARIGSAELYESTWQSVRFVGCKLGYVNLRGATLQDVVFTDCQIDELDLVQVRATRVAFDGTAVRRLDVQASTLQHVDLRGADLSELVGTDALRGTTITSVQLAHLAPLLAANLGITVVE
ncbi:pentapeptide repeat-containing protein [Isoptericola sp. 178]|uniref:pentapeptide repeat-containing protein n=1 Tax=Isoptericola sp. 178 TaxID=3064651 RepID=UPI0027128DF3|nr:pentapeptide repeat-containing protein [Isoptericola sp. 178]MDO8143605.1 pentapeptide repeat-containing protein [Isoptericola sp. 178]